MEQQTVHVSEYILECQEEKLREYNELVDKLHLQFVQCCNATEEEKEQIAMQYEDAVKWRVSWLHAVNVTKQRIKVMQLKQELEKEEKALEKLAKTAEAQYTALNRYPYFLD